MTRVTCRAHIRPRAGAAALAARAARISVALLLGQAALTTSACGESRLPIGEECLRDEDCLSNVCSARTCVPAPQLTVPYGGTPDQEPRIPDAAAVFDARPLPDAATDR